MRCRSHTRPSWRSVFVSWTRKSCPSSTAAAPKWSAGWRETFSETYRDDIGLPRYRQELERLHRPDIVYRNFSSHHAQVVNEMENARAALLRARREYVERLGPCSFRVEADDNAEFDAERRCARGKRAAAVPHQNPCRTRECDGAVQNDFLSRLKSSIEQVQDQVKNLNRALRQAQFGTDSYQFRVDRNPDYAEYYDMIMAPELMEGDITLFSAQFQEKYGPLIDKLFSQITMADDTQLNARKQSELQENIERYTDFRTYLKFDLETTDQNGSKQLLSQTLNTKSGGETQTPFYIAVLASFAQLYRVSDTSSFGNTVRLVVFDEAFNKMDSERIIESVRLLRKMGLQAIICTPPDKVSDIMPIADRTLLVDKHKVSDAHSAVQQGECTVKKNPAFSREKAGFLCDFGQAAPLDRRSPSIRLAILTLLYFAGRTSYNSPHMRCAERVLEGTAAERNRTECFGTASNLVFVQVHAAFQALRGDIHARTALDQVAHGGFQTGGYAACTEGFEVRPWGSRAARRRMTGRDRGTGAPEGCGCRFVLQVSVHRRGQAQVCSSVLHSHGFRLPVRHLPREMRQSQSNAA